jgi:hypothetical protein
MHWTYQLRTALCNFLVPARALPRGRKSRQRQTEAAEGINDSSIIFSPPLKNTTTRRAGSQKMVEQPGRSTSTKKSTPVGLLAVMPDLDRRSSPIVANEV